MMGSLDGGSYECSQKLLLRNGCIPS
jgi:hypothetical protein